MGLQELLSLQKINVNKKGDLAQTTEEQYGDCLHQYTVKEAIHDKAVLGFNVEYQTTMPGWAEDEIDEERYDDEGHMLAVLDAILNRSRRKLGFQNGVGKPMKPFDRQKHCPCTGLL